MTWNEKSWELKKRDIRDAKTLKRQFEKQLRETEVHPEAKTRIEKVLRSIDVFLAQDDVVLGSWMAARG